MCLYEQLNNGCLGMEMIMRMMTKGLAFKAQQIGTQLQQEPLAAPRQLHDQQPEVITWSSSALPSLF